MTRLNLWKSLESGQKLKTFRCEHADNFYGRLKLPSYSEHAGIPKRSLETVIRGGILVKKRIRLRVRDLRKFMLRTGLRSMHIRKLLGQGAKSMLDHSDKTPLSIRISLGLERLIAHPRLWNKQRGRRLPKEPKQRARRIETLQEALSRAKCRR